MKKVSIKKGFFYGAGSVYGWRNRDQRLHQFGVGIDMEILRIYDVIEVRVSKENYTLDCSKARDFISKYQSYKWIKGKCIGVVSKSLLDVIVKVNEKTKLPRSLKKQVRQTNATGGTEIKSQVHDMRKSVSGDAPLRSEERVIQASLRLGEPDTTVQWLPHEATPVRGSTLRVIDYSDEGSEVVRGVKKERSGDN